jgi:DNA-binding transcriptional regulator of glucitol operon
LIIVATDYRGRVLRALLTPRWLGRHLVLIGCWVAFGLLGRWQWDVAMSRTGGIQNLFYAIQWWTFAVVVTYGWWRLAREERRGVVPAEQPTTHRSVPAWLLRPPPEPPRTGPDPELDRYNAWLASLNASYEASRRRRSATGG